MRAAALVVLAACWTAPVPSRAPAPVVATRAPQWKRERRPPPPPGELANQLTLELRRSAADLLPAQIDGPVVLLDVDAGAFQTLCGVDAARAAQTWGQLLVDPARSPPSCSPMDKHFLCRQFGAANQPFLMLELSHDDAGFRLLSAVLGTLNSPRSSGSYRQMGSVQAHVDGATCP